MGEMRLDKINGYKDRTVEVLINNKEGDRLFILYPGFSYGYDHPLFFYLRELLEINKIDFIFFNYNWSEQHELLKLPDEEIEKEIYKEIDKSFKFLLNYSNRKISFLGKSVGTMALEHLHKKYLNNVFNIEKIYWLTPFKNIGVIKDINTLNRNKDIFYVGTADHYYNEEIYKKLSEKIYLNQFPGLGHVFEVEDDIQESIEGLKNVLFEIEKELKKNEE